MKSTTAKSDKKGTQQEGKGNSKKALSDTNHCSRNIFVEELKEIYLSEKALLISIPIMIKNAATEELADALVVHLEFTKQHIKRLEVVFSSIGESDVVIKYEAMYGLNKPVK
jgi:ferritin-like metal-binding protein YciE